MKKSELDVILTEAEEKIVNASVTDEMRIIFEDIDAAYGLPFFDYKNPFGPRPFTGLRPLARKEHLSDIEIKLEGRRLMARAIMISHVDLGGTGRRPEYTQKRMRFEMLHCATEAFIRMKKRSMLQEQINDSAEDGEDDNEKAHRRWMPQIWNTAKREEHEEVMREDLWMQDSSTEAGHIGFTEDKITVEHEERHVSTLYNNVQ